MDFHNERPFLDSARNREEHIQRTHRIWDLANRPEGEYLVAGRIIRPLTPTEEITLRGPCFSKCQDWSKLRLWLCADIAKQDQSPWLQQYVSFNTFVGVVVLGIDKEGDDDKGSIPPGIHSNAFLSNCILDAACRVYRNMCLSHTYIGPAASVLNCGTISCGKEVLFGSLMLSVGPERGGGRKILVTAESTMIDVCAMLGASKNRCDQQKQSTRTCNMNFIGAGSMVRDTPDIESLYLAEYSRIECATSVRNAVLLPTAFIGNACTVNNVMLQWNASIVDNSYISNSVLMEHAHTGPKCIVVESILGPDVHVSAGEIHASVIGPNTNAHHQSLVIGVLWLLGRGNVGYGANVGSNHTGRLPDQETCSGEGTFWGLSCIVKFPVDLSYSPYSIVAAGTTVGPQRVAMPFSLLVDVKGETQIIPGWLLQSSPYTLTRNAIKFTNRRKATHHKFYTGWNLIRPDIVDMCWVARESLRGVSTLAPEYKTEQVVPGIGSTTLTEKGRQSGIQAYTQCIQRYAAGGLLQWIQNNMGEKMISSLECELQDVHFSPDIGLLTNPSWPNLPWEVDETLTWKHQMAILQSEFPRNEQLASWVEKVLKQLVKIETDYATRVYKCKRRDDIRGIETIPGYSQSHVAAEDDDVIKNANEAAALTANVVKTLLVNLSNAGGSDSSRSRL